MLSAASQAERAARESFGRLLSWLAWQWRDIAAAEDALGDALLKALEVWPVSGIPAAPDAWLLAVAKRQLLQVARQRRLHSDPAVMALLAEEEEASATPDIPDARLKLLFVCAHPAIDARLRTPLMLQTVLGLQAAEIAPAMLLAPSTLAQRLVRAKQKIRDAGLRFEEPEARDLPQRLHDVLEAIYAAFGLSCDAVDGAESRITDLRDEAVYLGQLVCQLLPDAAEAWGLVALMQFVLARQAAQIDGTGAFVPLAQQDVALWDRPAILLAERALWQAAHLRQPGPFQLEAAVQSAHCQRLFRGSTPWPGIAALYAQINLHFPTIGAQVAGAVAVAEAGDWQAGLAQLRALDNAQVRGFQPWWVALGHLLALSGDHLAADQAFARAIGLSTQQRIKAHLQARRKALASFVPPTP